MISPGAYVGGQAINATGIGNNISESQSANLGLGFGYTTGSSYNEGGGSSYEVGDSYSQSQNYSDSWGKIYGSEASAKDIERAKEANEVAFGRWQEQANFNADEAVKQRQWQEYMSNTAYQRAVKDLVAAGLNPYLAATNLGGASTPAGAMASSGLATAHKAQTFPDEESQSHSEGSSTSRSHNEGGGSNYSVGGSNNYGINFEINSGKSSSTSEPALGKIITNAVKTATNSTSAKKQYDDRGFEIKNSSSGGSWKGFESNAYD